MIGHTVLVTGATGFIGSHLVESLAAGGACVRCLVRPKSPRSRAARHPLPAGVESATGDLITGEGLESALEGADVVFHLAGVTKALRVSDYYRGNVRATANLLAACDQAGTRRLVHASSLAAAGPSPDGRPLREEAPPHPLTHYGASKLKGEQEVRQSPLAARSVIVRPAVVYGPRDSDVLEVFRSAARGRVVQIGGQDTCFSVIYVADLIEGLLLAARSEIAAGKTYYLANADPVTWSEFGHRAAALMGRGSKTVSVPVWAAYAAGTLAGVMSRLRGAPGILSREKIKEARQRYWTCDSGAARADLGFRARTPLSDGIAATLQWYREQGWLKF